MTWSGLKLIRRRNELETVSHLPVLLGCRWSSETRLDSLTKTLLMRRRATILRRFRLVGRRGKNEAD